MGDLRSFPVEPDRACPTPAEVEALVHRETGERIEVLYTCLATDGSGDVVVVLKPPPLASFPFTFSVR